MLAQINQPDFIIESTIGMQKVEERAYRWSRYALRREHDGGMLCYNALTCETVFIDFAWRFDLETKQELISKWFLVPVEFDEFRQAKKAKKIRQAVYRADLRSNKGNSIDSFWILTTTLCNARCFYCHEKGIPQTHMNLQTARDTVNYIDKLCTNKKVHIMWYGGEPLINREAIDFISGELKQLGFRYNSSMISNGLEFDSTVAEKAHLLWHLGDVQITLDGLEDTYNRVKSYCEPGRQSPFLKVLNNIGELLECGIKVRVRLNIDTYNSDELFRLSDLLSERFGGYPHFCIYPAPLLENCLGTTYVRDRARRNKVYKEYFKLRDKLAATGILFRTELPKAMRSETRCIATANARVIFPDGKLAFCHDYSDGVLSGDIYGNEPSDEERMQYTKCLSEMDICSDCPKYPQCVRLEKCFNNQCNEELVNEWILCTEQEMIWEYEKQPPS